jgi:beta-lactamase superfamily II metal-dependent hydrolase
MANEVRVRMYNVGFGDCFLCEFPREGQPFRVLIDCGAHSAGYPTKGWQPEDVVDTIVGDITAGDGDPSIDVVVATHRHQDHVVGFRAQAWSDVRVGEVWMPWTEEPNNPTARAIRDRQHRLGQALGLALDEEHAQQRYANAPEMLQSARDLVSNSLTNEKAMSTLHSGFGGRPKRRFLSDRTGSIELGDCPGLRVHVLGPSTDESVVRDMDPPRGQSYLRYIGEPPTHIDRFEEQLALSGVDEQRPFPRSYAILPEQFAREQGWSGLQLEAEIKDTARDMTRADDIATIVGLDKAINGTSVVLVFEFGNAVLLFPGDAQWGTWETILKDSARRELVSRTTFYKVGHHGSHNATPVEFVEQILGSDIGIAATSVHRIANWPEIPKTKLLNALKKHGADVVRSDHPGESGPNREVRRDGVGVDFVVPH